jgi:general secretion pathway protein D
VFLSVLQIHGYSAVSSGNVIKIVPDVNAKQGPIPMYLKRRLPSDQLVTKVIKIKNVPAAQLVPILRPLIPQQGHMAAYTATNTLILTDRVGNIERIEKIIKKVDIPDNQEIEVITLNYASASEVVRIINALNQKKGNGGNVAGRPQLAADDRTNSILMSGDTSNRLRLRVLINHLDTPLKKNSGNTKVIYLHYANAKELATILKGVSDSIKDKPKKSNTNKLRKVDIRAHETTNALVITAPPVEMQNLREIISQLDIRRAQVLIEAIIAEVKEDKSRELGVQLGSASKSSGALITSFAEGTNNNILSAIAGGSTGSGLSLAFANKSGDFGGLARLLNSDASTNILSTPSIVTLDNQEAKIVVGQNAPFVTGSYTSSGSTSSATNPFQTIERRDIGLTLKVKPQINEGNTIKMEISQEVSNLASSSTTAGPTTNKRTIDTTVLVEDGQTLVLGGLIDDAVQEKEERVPGLGDIPFIGALFSYKTTQKVKQNLMVFIHPTILRDIKTENLSTSQKYKYMRALELDIVGEGSYLLDEDMPVLPELNISVMKPENTSNESSQNE